MELGRHKGGAAFSLHLSRRRLRFWVHEGNQRGTIEVGGPCGWVNLCDHDTAANSFMQTRSRKPLDSYIEKLTPTHLRVVHDGRENVN